MKIISFELELGFAYIDKNKKEKILEFYNDRLALTIELQLAEKWCKIFNEQVSVIEKKHKSTSQRIAG